MSGIVCSGISKRFGGTAALSGVDFHLDAGEVVALVGQNGAGKSTLMGVLAGVVQPDDGSMRIDEAEYRPTGPGDAVRSGLALIHQETRLVKELSVAENVFLGQPLMRRGCVDLPGMVAQAEAALADFGVDIDARAPAGDLSIAAQQQVEIVKALRREPRYVVFDEPTASFGDRETDKVLDHIAELRRRGVGVVYISHRLDEVIRIADRIVVLRNGRVVTEFERGAATQDDLVTAMAGRPLEEEFHSPPEHQEDVVLTVRDLGRTGVFSGVGFDVRRGEILGIAGLVGARRTEVLRAIFGADGYDAGFVEVDGVRLRKGDPRAAMRAGIGFVPEDRKNQGVVLAGNSWENLSLPWLTAAVRRGALSTAVVRESGAAVAEQLDIRGDLDRPVSTLSGGNQQKVVIGKWLPQRPKVLLLDEPTRGVDIAAKESIYQAIYRLAADGMALVVVSSELEEVLGLAHRVLVMSAGRQSALLDRGEADNKQVLDAAFHNLAQNDSAQNDSAQNDSAAVAADARSTS